MWYSQVPFFHAVLHGKFRRDLAVRGLEFNPIPTLKPLGSGIGWVNENAGQRATFTQFRDIPLTGLEERILANTGEDGVWVFFGECGTFSIIRHWIET